jgi:cytosine/adenosine deaminase-related metal-dependent hydrolase
MTLYLKNATYLDWRSLEMTAGHLAVSSGDRPLLAFIDQVPGAAERGPDDILLDCTGRLVTRAFGCGHHHLYSTLARGMPAPRSTPRNFTETLRYIWWHLDQHLDDDAIEAGALAGALFCAKNGVTFVIDHHSSPFAAERSLFLTRQAFEAVGIAHLLCYELSDRDGPEARDAGLAVTEGYLNAGHPGLVGLHASFTVGDELLDQAVGLARRFGTGLHVHVAEDRCDQEHCHRHYGRQVIERFDAAGVLDMPQTLLVHGVHLNDAERARIRRSKAWVVACVESNLNNNVGLADYNALGERILLGTDGLHSDMLRCARSSYLVGQTTGGITPDGIYQRLRHIHRYLENNGFPGDGDNNLVVLDYPSPTEVHAGNLAAHLVFGLDAAHIESVIAGGRLIVKNRQLITQDESAILERAREAGRRLWKRLLSTY